MTIRAIAIAVLLTSLTIYVLREGAALVAPIFVSLLVSYAIEPLVVLVMRARVSRVGAALLVYLMFGVIAGSVARQTVKQVDAFLADLPTVVDNARRMWTETASRTPSTLSNVQEAARELGEAVGSDRTPPPAGVQRVQPLSTFRLGDYLAAASASAVVTGTQVAVIGLLSFLMICIGDLYKRKLVMLGGRAFADRRVTVEVIRAIDRQIQRYLIVRLFISAIVAAATSLGLWIAGMSHAIVWGLIAGVLNVLPFIGPTVAVLLITAAAFLQFKTFEPTLLAGGVALTVAALEGNLITPTLTSRAGEINTVAVFVSVLFWGWLWGAPGLLLGVPIMVALKAAADHIEPLQPLGELLGL